MIGGRISRRELLWGAARSAALAPLLGCSPGRSAGPGGLPRVGGSGADRVLVPERYRHGVVIRWGDALFPAAASLDARAVETGALLGAGAAAEQARQFGYNCDGMAIFELADGRTILCVNHEYPSPELMFPGWSEARTAGGRGAFVHANPQIVRYMQACVGVSIVEVDRRRGWQPIVDSKLNRRVTASDATAFSGPARSHRLLVAGLDGTLDSPFARGFGTFGNCASGKTPWGTYLSAEENVDDFFGNGEHANFDAETRRAHRRFGYRRRDSAFRWEYADPRFDLASNPQELLKFGWIVEIDPLDPSSPVTKRTALGRFKHEGATCAVCSDGRVAVYMGDDQVFEYFYKFVSEGRIDQQDRRANSSLLDRGTLHVARCNGDGSGEWLPLVWSEDGPLSPANGFTSQADVVLHCRAAADLLGATPLDRPEDVAVDSATGRIYLSCTQNLERGGERSEFAGREIANGVDAVNPRPANRFGHIVEISEAGDDFAARTFRWEVFIMAGAPSRTGLETDVAGLRRPDLGPDSTYFAGFADLAELSAFANPDNMTCDSRGNLWIVTDGPQPLGGNNGCFLCKTTGPERGAVAQFMSGPVGAEVSGCEITADERALLLTIQHPGAGGTLAATISRWPDGAGAPRPSLIVIEPVDATMRVGDA